LMLAAQKPKLMPQGQRGQGFASSWWLVWREVTTTKKCGSKWREGKIRLQATHLRLFLGEGEKESFVNVIDRAMKWKQTPLACFEECFNEESKKLVELEYGL
jgi:hypothetical protein